MGAAVQVDVDAAGLVERFRVRFEKRLPEARKQLTRELARDVLHTTIHFNPVATARSRASWVASLTKLGWAPPPGWQGWQARIQAIREGRRQSDFTLTHNKDATTIEATSDVDYVTYLEYGTRHMAPFAMIRRSFRHTAQVIGHNIRLAERLK